MLGQCYEIMNDLGANVAAVLDDNQASYANMEDYIELTRAENYHNEKDKPQFDLSMVLNRDPNEKDFSTAWGEGIKMKWNYVPLEDQKTHINWRQSINDDGSGLMRLASFPGNEANAGANIIKSPGIGNIMEANRAAMESYKASNSYEQAVIPLINRGKSNTGDKDDCVNLYRGEGMKPFKERCSSESIDPLVIASLAFTVGNSDFNAVIDKYKNIADKIGTKNPAIIISAYGSSTDVFTGNQTLPRIDQPTKKKGGKDNKDEEEDGVSIKWEEREGWLWTDFAARFVARAGGQSQNLDLFPRVCYLYCVVLPECMNSRYDDGEMGFPFTDEEIAQGIAYTSPFGWRESTQSFHRGIDLGAAEGTPIHACHSGTIIEDGNGAAFDLWHGICLDHGDGYYSRYLHCAEMYVTVGQTVNRGDVIGTVGNVGPGSMGAHLHLEIDQGDAVATKSNTDPLDFFPKLKGSVSVGESLSVY